jgi:hypothetical protein
LQRRLVEIIAAARSASAACNSPSRRWNPSLALGSAWRAIARFIPGQRDVLIPPR